jgi:thiamine biosynthesis lipoprotein
LVQLKGRCLSTSGDYATSFSADHRHHHLFDPRTGRSPQGFSSVSIAATTALEADALSTAVFVLEPEKGLELVRATPGADALLVFKDGRTLATQGFPTWKQEQQA